MQIGIVGLAALEGEATGRSARGEHEHKRSPLPMEVFSTDGPVAGGAHGRRGRHAIVLERLARGRPGPVRAGAASLALGLLLGAGQELGQALLELLDFFLDLGLVVLVLAFSAVVPEELDMAVAQHGRRLRLSGLGLGNRLCLGAQTKRNALDALVVAEIRRQEVETHSEVASRSRWIARRPGDSKAVEPLRFDNGLRMGLGGAGSGNLAGLELDRLQSSLALACFCGSAALLPHLPALRGTLALLLLFEGDADAGPVFERCWADVCRLCVHDGNEVHLALVEVREGGIIRLLDHGCLGVQRDVEAETVRGQRSLRVTLKDRHHELGAWLRHWDWSRSRLSSRLSSRLPTRLPTRLLVRHGGCERDAGQWMLHIHVGWLLGVHVLEEIHVGEVEVVEEMVRTYTWAGGSRGRKVRWRAGNCQW